MDISDDEEQMSLEEEEQKQQEQQIQQQKSPFAHLNGRIVFEGEWRPYVQGGDRIQLPSSILESLMSLTPHSPMGKTNGNSYFQSQNSVPLTFQISNISSSNSSNRVSAGVLQFTSEEGVVLLPEYIVRSLQLQPNDIVQIQFKSLAKGKYAKLHPLHQDYLKIQDFRAALESLLRSNFTTLTQGQLITMNQQGKQFDILVSELKPEGMVSITDTELEVDITPLDDFGAHKSDEPQELLLEKTLDGKVSKDEFDYYTFKSSSTQQFKVFLKVFLGDADLFISNVNKRPNEIDNDFFAVEKGNSEIVLPTESGQTYYISVKGYDPESHYQISVSPWIEKKENEVSETQQPEVGSQQCENCLRWIPEANFQRHVIFCTKNNVLCSICKKSFHKNQIDSHVHCKICQKAMNSDELEKHEKMMHSLFQCVCGEFFDLNLMREHRKHFCEERMITCQYCQNYVKAGKHSQKYGYDVSEHEEYCGSRTADCPICKKSVPLKDFRVHSLHHEYMKKSLPLPLIVCRNQCCANQMDSANPLGLCQRCYGPFWSPTDDPGKKKLLQRIVSKYHLQLTIGCKNPKCRNPYCVSNEKSEAKTKNLDANASAIIALQLVKKSSLQLPISQSEYYFCVDNSVSKRRFLANQLQNMGFSIEWCLKALLETKDNVESAANWLALHAPSQ